MPLYVNVVHCNASMNNIFKGEKIVSERLTMNAFNRKQFILDQLKWMAIYWGITFVIMILLPFPIDFAVTLPAFLLLSLYRRKLLLRKLGIRSGSSKDSSIGLSSFKDFFKYFSFKTFHSIDYGDSQMKYYCMRCGNEHREISCPRCGSKMKRVG